MFVNDGLGEAKRNEVTLGECVFVSEACWDLFNFDADLYGNTHLKSLRLDAALTVAELNVTYNILQHNLGFELVFSVVALFSS